MKYSMGCAPHWSFFSDAFLQLFGTGHVLLFGDIITFAVVYASRFSHNNDRSLPTKGTFHTSPGVFSLVVFSLQKTKWTFMENFDLNFPHNCASAFKCLQTNSDKKRHIQV